MIDLESITHLTNGDRLHRITIPSEIEPFMRRGARAWLSYSGLRVIACYEPYLEGQFGELLHVSFSRPRVLPNWKEVRVVKDTFFGENLEAMVVLPKTSEYTNLHPYTHHLWQIPEPWTDAGPILGGPHATIDHRREDLHQADGRPPDEPAGSGLGDRGDAALESEPVHAPGEAGGQVHAAADE